jgi:hypothetical protein
LGGSATDPVTANLLALTELNNGATGRHYTERPSQGIHGAQHLISIRPRHGYELSPTSCPPPQHKMLETHLGYAQKNPSTYLQVDA